MKKMIMLVVLMLGITNLVNAMVDPFEGEQPVLGSWNMKVANASGMFKNYESGFVTLFKDVDTDEFTSISVELLNPLLDNRFYEKMDIINIDESFCGDRYTASFVDHKNYRRVHVELVDMSNATCEIYVKHLWTVKVTEGYGFCGTMDSKITVVGDPEPVVSIMDSVN